MSAAARTRKYRDIFTTVRQSGYIELYFLGNFVCNCDNDQEVEEEEKHRVTGY